MAQYAAGLRAVDISNLEKPMKVSTICVHYREVCYDVEARDGYIFITDSWNGSHCYYL